MNVHNRPIKKRNVIFSIPFVLPKTNNFVCLNDKIVKVSVSIKYGIFENEYSKSRFAFFSVHESYNQTSNM